MRGRADLAPQLLAERKFVFPAANNRRGTGDKSNFDGDTEIVVSWWAISVCHETQVFPKRRD